jgi:hypothetical protein
MPHALTPVSPWPRAARPVAHVSYALMRRRMHTVGIPDRVLEDCQLIGDVQREAPSYFRQQAKRLHPDTAIWRPCVALSRVSGAGFRRLCAAYAWLMGLNPHARLKRLPALPAPVLEHDYPDVGRGYHIFYM